MMHHEIDVDFSTDITDDDYFLCVRLVATTRSPSPAVEFLSSLIIIIIVIMPESRSFCDRTHRDFIALFPHNSERGLSGDRRSPQSDMGNITEIHGHTRLNIH